MHAIPSLIRPAYKQALLILSCLLLISCSESKELPDPNATEKIELINGESLARFSMLASYKAQKETKGLMVFSLN